MKTFEIFDANFIFPSEDLTKGQEFEPYLVISLKDEMGIPLSFKANAQGLEPKEGEKVETHLARIVVSEKQLDNELRKPLGRQSAKGITNFQKLCAINGGKLLADVSFKRAGNTFIASEFTKEYFDDKKKKWLPAVAGTEYPIYRSNYRIEYEKPVSFEFVRSELKEIDTALRIMDAQKVGA